MTKGISRADSLQPSRRSSGERVRVADVTAASDLSPYGFLWCVFLTVSTLTSVFFCTTVVSVALVGVTVVSVVFVVSCDSPPLHAARTRNPAINGSLMRWTKARPVPRTTPVGSVPMVGHGACFHQRTASTGNTSL